MPQVLLSVLYALLDFLQHLNPTIIESTRASPVVHVGLYEFSLSLQKNQRGPSA